MSRIFISLACFVWSIIGLGFVFLMAAFKDDPPAPSSLAVILSGGAVLLKRIEPPWLIFLALFLIGTTALAYLWLLRELRLRYGRTA